MKRRNKMAKLKAARGWMLTQSCAKITLEELKAALSEYVYIAQKERGSEGGEQGYEHYQIYIENPSPIRFDTLKNKLPNAHIEPRRGTKQEAYDYVTKSDTKLGENFGNGEIDLTVRQGQRVDIEDVMQMVRDGKTNREIEQVYPAVLFKYRKAIEETRQSYLKDKFGSIFRELKVTYIYGKAGKGKTRYVMEKHGYDNVYRVTDWTHPFDNYNGQSIMLFEEFRSSCKVEQMLNYLDGYPIELPARYAQRTACYETVYITTNIPLEAQYVKLQETQPETWRAFLRRIHYVWHIGVMPEPVPRETLYPIVRQSLNLVPTNEDLPF